MGAMKSRNHKLQAPPSLVQRCWPRQPVRARRRRHPARRSSLSRFSPLAQRRIRRRTPIDHLHEFGGVERICDIAAHAIAVHRNHGFARLLWSAKEIQRGGRVGEAEPGPPVFGDPITRGKARDTGH